MEKRLLELKVENFRSLRKVTVPLGALNVLVGPNGAGKTNVLEVFRFLADVIRTDLRPAFDMRSGFDQVAFWGGKKPPVHIEIKLKATWTTHSSPKDVLKHSLARSGPRYQESDAPDIFAKAVALKCLDHPSAPIGPGVSSGPKPANAVAGTFHG